MLPFQIISLTRVDPFQIFSLVGSTIFTVSWVVIDCETAMGMPMIPPFAATARVGVTISLNPMVAENPSAPSSLR